jgi:hypothetical protein
VRLDGAALATPLRLGADLNLFARTEELKD